MKHILLATGSFGVLALGAPVLGADLPVKARAVAPTVHVGTGFYVRLRRLEADIESSISERPSE